MKGDPAFAGPFRIVGKEGHPVTSLQDWKRHGQPAGGSKQWKDHRSAKEAARAWTARAKRPQPPKELKALLYTATPTSDMSFHLVRPEARLPLDKYRGNNRNTDVAVYGQAKAGPTFVAIEAKADESFGQTIKAAIEGPAPEGSKRRARVNELSRVIFGRAAESNGRLDSDLAVLRYQLLHGLAGTVFEADRSGASQAVFVVHEFSSRHTNDKRLKANHEALNAFLSALGRGPIEIGKLLLIEPIKGLSGRAIPTYVGKITTNSAEASARPEIHQS